MRSATRHGGDLASNRAHRPTLSSSMELFLTSDEVSEHPNVTTHNGCRPTAGQGRSRCPGMLRRCPTTLDRLPGVASHASRYGYETVVPCPSGAKAGLVCAVNAR